MKSLLKAILPSVILTMMMASMAVAEVAVIVNKSNVVSMEDSYIAKIYLGKVKVLPNGRKVMPLDQKPGSDIRKKFLKAVVGKKESQFKSFWARLIFTGKGVPPSVVEGDDEMKKRVAANENAIGFIDVSSVDDTVRVIKTHK